MLTTSTGRGPTLRDRLPLVDLTLSQTTVQCQFLLDQVGVSRDDVAAYDNVESDLVIPAGEAARYFWSDLGRLATRWPEMSVRASVGWVVITEVLYQSDYVGLIERVEPWVEAGLGEDGWLCVAAKVTIEEAWAGLATDAETWRDGLFVLAGLSGMPLPSTR